jgi:hypothetical protein
MRCPCGRYHQHSKTHLCQRCRRVPCVECGAEHTRPETDLCTSCRRERDLTARALRQRAAYQPKRKLSDRCSACTYATRPCVACRHLVSNRLHMRAMRQALRDEQHAEGIVIRNQGRPRKDGTETRKQVA